ncbi:MAG: hypothetical protein IH594_02230 [Bacteroidales bacterium]|nr:hypothetical protein [Bacteroidales bacterium]
MKNLLLSGGGLLLCLGIFLFPVNKSVSKAFQKPLEDPEMPIVILGDEQSRLNMDLADGGLPPLPGVHNFQLLRTTRDRPDLAENEGWTYAHHQDLAAWKGRLYAAWAMTPKDEDYPPYKVLYATSPDGHQWTRPAELFPEELSWALRFYFYRASNGRMLAMCASRAEKLAMLVREISDDHQLGEVHTLINPQPGLPSFFTEASDQGFVDACKDAVQNKPLLEQSDLGSFLEERKMKWHDITPPYGGFYPFGKGFCFYHRADGKLVGVSKMGFTTVSPDEGETWSEPVLPPTLLTGAGKVWGQRANDGKYVLVYNPDGVNFLRYPLVLVQGDDGSIFENMRVVHGENPRMRYPGMYKDFGPQYTRGLAEWSNDGSFDPDAIWLIYSVHKEDVWLSRIPLPLASGASVFPDHDFQQSSPGRIVDGWNVYSPKWAPVGIISEPENPSNLCLELRDGDPYDYARAKCLFPADSSVTVSFRVRPAQTDAELEIELEDGYGRRPARLVFGKTGQLHTTGGDYSQSLGSYAAGEWIDLKLECDQGKNSFVIAVNGTIKARMKLSDASAMPVQLLSLRTGEWRGKMTEDFRWNKKEVQSDSNRGPVETGTDKPLDRQAVFLVDNVKIQSNSR